MTLEIVDPHVNSIRLCISYASNSMLQHSHGYIIESLTYKTVGDICLILM